MGDHERTNLRNSKWTGVMRLLSTRGRQRPMTIDASNTDAMSCFSYLFYFISCTLDLNLIVYNAGEPFFCRFYHVCVSFTVIGTDLFLLSSRGVFPECDMLRHAVSFVLGLL